MSLAGILAWLFPGKGRRLGEVAARLDVSKRVLRRTRPAYESFSIPKKTGGRRLILAPAPELKDLQRRILQRGLRRLRAHPCATGFERGYSIVSNATIHTNQAVVVRIDVKDFFPSTQSRRVSDYFRAIGWNRDVARVLTRLCTENGGLPQGAPTSPRLSNLLNYRLDARLAGLAARYEARYSRYADDLTFSFARDDADAVRTVIRCARSILRDDGYRMNRRKLRVSRRSNRQTVTGLVVNAGVRLPRTTRRWLRAVEHRRRTTGSASLTDAQLQGWRSLASMVAQQTAAFAPSA